MLGGNGELLPVAVVKAGQAPTNGADYVDGISGGTITFMSYAVGYKVLTGVGFLLLLLLGLLAPEREEDEKKEDEAL